MSEGSPAATANDASHHHQHHNHHPGLGHAHSHEHANMAEANKKHYDENAAHFDDYPHAKERAKRTALAIREAVSLSKENSSVLEFACGTGLVCKEMLPYVKEIVGIDISPGVVAYCNKRFKEEGATDDSYALAANIVTDKDVLPGRKFDLVYCASAYHHLEDPEEITKLLGQYLKPGGSLMIIDNLQKGGETVEEQHRAYVTRFGFTEEDIKLLYAGAGLEFVSYAQVPPDEGDMDIFIAKGVKGA